MTQLASTEILRPEIGSVANWFGTDGAVVDRVAAELAGCRWIGVPFAGGMGVLASLRCNQGVASDLHCHVINLATVIADPELSEQLAESLACVPLNSHALEMAKFRCMAIEQDHADDVRRAITLFDGFGGTPASRAFAKSVPDVRWARDYFIVSWMGRAGDSGTDREFAGGDISVRWKATGGSSSSRWRTAVDSIPGWRDVMKRWAFVSLDAFEFLDQCLKVEHREKGTLSNGLYLDPPFPDAGEPYVHTFTEDDQIRLAQQAGKLKQTRVVLRYHDHPLIRRLYPESAWTYVRLTGRKQTNAKADEVLILNGPSLAGRSA